MKFSQVMSSGGEWLRGEGPHHQVVVSSRVRLARNLRHHPFPGWAKKAERTQILEQIKPQEEGLTEMQDSFSELLQDLSALEKQVLVERHLISREHAAKGVGSAVVMNRKQTLSIMINEEDHLRMQSIRSGLQLKSAFKLVDKVDSTLEARLDIAYDQDFLATLPDAYFDWIYLDTTHTYEQTRLELQLLQKKVKPSGVIAGDDWQPDPAHPHHGVYKAVQEVIADGKYRILYADAHNLQWAIGRVDRSSPSATP